MAQVEQFMSAPMLSEKLDQLIGEVRGMRETMGGLSNRMVVVEQETKSTKEIVEAWSAAKTWLRWFKWIVGLVASLGAIFAAYKGLAK
ncbi:MULTISPECIES: hypothetical protein [Sphingobium]|uniref:hypothetical protein n=2 Tax=Sphingomonadaceae TaxID=41297 RepID=UPI001612A1EC|nr:MULTISPECIES: hypothetical protein [Sphingobium]MCW2400867.1 hypothetical protein [Sphingobium sp. B10D7B]